MEYKLSKLMATALENMLGYGDYELWELRRWNTWNAVKNGQCAPSIRTDTMQALVKRGLAQEKYDETRIPWGWTATLTDAGRACCTTYRP